MNTYVSLKTTLDDAMTMWGYAYNRHAVTYKKFRRALKSLSEAETLLEHKEQHKLIKSILKTTKNLDGKSDYEVGLFDRFACAVFYVACDDVHEAIDKKFYADALSESDGKTIFGILKSLSCDYNKFAPIKMHTSRVNELTTFKHAMQLLAEIEELLGDQGRYDLIREFMDFAKDTTMCPEEVNKLASRVFDSIYRSIERIMLDQGYEFIYTKCDLTVLDKELPF